LETPSEGIKYTPVRSLPARYLLNKLFTNDWQTDAPATGRLTIDYLKKCFNFLPTKLAIMKKYLIGSFVGAIIIFIWQAASWMLIGVHDRAMKYTPAQENIMSVLANSNLDEALYMIPSAPTKKEQQEKVKEMEGKPWASIIYHKEFKMEMAMPMIRGFLVDIFLVISLIYILTRGATPIPRRVFTGSVAIGLFSWLWGEYTGHIWFDLPMSMILPNLVDSIVAWGLCGLWLGWWLNRREFAGEGPVNK